jgi:carotenoid cleavage dioxygenase-like enzyme
MIKAHTKFDPLTGEWLLFGISHRAGLANLNRALSGVSA